MSHPVCGTTVWTGLTHWMRRRQWADRATASPRLCFPAKDTLRPAALCSWQHAFPTPSCDPKGTLPPSSCLVCLVFCHNSDESNKPLLCNHFFTCLRGHRLHPRNKRKAQNTDVAPEPSEMRPRRSRENWLFGKQEESDEYRQTTEDPARLVQTQVWNILSSLADLQGRRRMLRE